MPLTSCGFGLENVTREHARCGITGASFYQLGLVVGPVALRAASRTAWPWPEIRRPMFTQPHHCLQCAPARSVLSVRTSLASNLFDRGSQHFMTLSSRFNGVAVLSSSFWTHRTLAPTCQKGYFYQG